MGTCTHICNDIMKLGWNFGLFEGGILEKILCEITNLCVIETKLTNDPKDGFITRASLDYQRADRPVEGQCLIHENRKHVSFFERRPSHERAERVGSKIGPASLFASDLGVEKPRLNVIQSSRPTHHVVRLGDGISTCDTPAVASFRLFSFAFERFRLCRFIECEWLLCKGGRFEIKRAEKSG